MAENSKIEWCHHTFNPWIGCTKVSEGCAHCYAEKSTPARVLRHQGQETWGEAGQRSRTSAANWKEPLKWNLEAKAMRMVGDVMWAQIGESDGKAVITDQSCSSGGTMPYAEWDALPHFRPRVFCASLADWLDDEVPIEWFKDLLGLIHDTPNLDWLLLTKRPQNWRARLEQTDHDVIFVTGDHVANHWLAGKPPANVWIGTTVENQARADERIPHLLSIPAKVRFLSCEPLLGPLDIEEHLEDQLDGGYVLGSAPIHWVICGGESGTHARAMHPEWARSLRDQCSAAGVAFFFKQWGEWLPGCQYREGDRERFREKAQHSFCHDHHSWWVGKKLAGRMLDGRTHDEFPKTEGGRP